MFNSLSGTVTYKNSKQLFLECGGVEWDICMPDSNLETVGDVGSGAKVFVWLQHTDMNMCLYGFSTQSERALFFDLLKVDGVGPKGAVKIMSSVNSKKLTEILESGDVGLLEKIPGVGKKTAGKMMLALKGKLTFSPEEKIIRVQKNSLFADVEDSLVSMGYDKKRVEEKIAELSGILEPEFEGKSQKEKEDLIFRKAIVALS